MLRISDGNLSYNQLQSVTNVSNTYEQDFITCSFIKCSDCMKLHIFLQIVNLVLNTRNTKSIPKDIIL